MGDPMTPLAKSDKTPVSRLWYALALAVFLLCTTGVIVTVYKAIKSFPEGTQFPAPGSLTLTVEQPGEYVIWDEQVTFFNGKSYRSSEDLPGGMQIAVRDAQSGRTFKFSPSSGGTETIGNVKRKSIGAVSLDRPGNYIIEVSGSFPERVFYLRMSAVSTVLSGIAISAALGLIGWVLAPIAAIVVYVKRSNALAGDALQAAVRPTTASPAAAAPMDTEEERTYAMFCHLGALSGFVVPFGNIIVPLILWLTKRESSPFVDMHGKEAINFQISLLIYFLISAVLILLLVGIFLLAGLCIFNLVIVIIAGVRAKSGESFRYPLTIRFIK
jgi:hypothetical protein